MRFAINLESVIRSTRSNYRLGVNSLKPLNIFRRLGANYCFQLGHICVGTAFFFFPFFFFCRLYKEEKFTVERFKELTVLISLRVMTSRVAFISSEGKLSLGLSLAVESCFFASRFSHHELSRRLNGTCFCFFFLLRCTSSTQTI